MPWWALQLATGAKSFVDNPLLGSRRLNAWGLHRKRVALAYEMAEKRRARLAAPLDPADVAAFQRDGFILKRDFLPPAEFDALRDEVLNLQAPAREMVQGDAITRRIALDPATLRGTPHLRGLLASSRWQALMNYVASYRMAPINYIQTILNQTREAAPDPQTHLHADTFHPNLKAWLFLTDVPADEGPFTYVPGSHRPTPQRLAWEERKSLDQEQLDRLSRRGSLRVEPEELPMLGYAQPQAFAVPANTLVVADTYGFHARGPSVRPSTRVEIWAYGRRNPFWPWVGLDPWSIPGLTNRQAVLFWWVKDQMQRYAGQPNVWRAAGVKRPADAP